MKTLISRIAKPGLIKFEFILGIIFMALALFGIPGAMMIYNIELLAEPSILGTIIVASLVITLVAFLRFVLPYINYRKYPLVQVETDGEFLYIHTKKEAKIPLVDLENVYVNADLPFIFQKEFLREFIVHMASGEFGDVTLEIPNYGTYKMRYVERATESANELAKFIDDFYASKNKSDDLL